MSKDDELSELSVTFNPPLYLQRRGWVLDIMRRENVKEILDIGCAEGELLSCLCNPAPWLRAPPHNVLSPTTLSPTEAEVLAELHYGILHPTKIAGLDICKEDLEQTAQATEPPPVQDDSVPPWCRPPTRWEPLEVNIWEGGLEHFNPAFVDTECIVATEVIEHLPEHILDRFGPVVLGAYQPRLLLITTPSYTFNARFTAPDAPREARRGWPDPTARTSRIFRHSDHKFEWTIAEFREWCEAVGAAWGYDVVDFGGVGKAVEDDEWGRDDELGFASQVAAFRRREGSEAAEERARRWEEVHTEGGQRTGEHRLLATHRHSARADARRPQPMDVVGDLVLSKLVSFRETAVPLTEMWFEREVEAACGGWIDWLVHAIQVRAGLGLEKGLRGLSRREEWLVQLDPGLHHLIPPESQTETPPEVDEAEDAWDGNDEDDDDIAVRGENENEDNEEDKVVGGWGSIAAGDTEEMAWGELGGRWGEETKVFGDGVSSAWGVPQCDWT